MKERSIVKHIALSGILAGLAILLGFFARFPLLGGNVYLIGIIVFIMPLLLRIDFALITAAISVVIVDLLWGWINYSWISVIAYCVPVIFIKLINKIKFIGWLLIPVAFIISGAWATGSYFILEYKFVDQGLAWKDLIATAIQFAIVVPVSILIYAPIKMYAKYK